MLKELVEWQLSSGSDFSLAKRRFDAEIHFPRNINQLDSLIMAAENGHLDYLDEPLESYKWVPLRHGLMGRDAPGVGADMAINFYFDAPDKCLLGLYSVDTYWDGPAGPAWVGVRKLSHSIPIAFRAGGSAEDELEEDDFDDDHDPELELVVYREINEAAKKSKMVRLCRACGKTGPGWELQDNPCIRCSPRVY